MISGPFLTVTFEVPQKVWEKVNSGEWKIWGGIVRDLQGEIKGHLTKGRQLVEMANQGLPIDAATLSKAVGSAELAAQMSSGIGLLNLGLTAAGLAMVKSDLNRISGKLDAAIDELSEIKEEVGWISLVTMAEIKAKIDTAIVIAERATSQENLHLFNEAKTRCFEIRHTLQNILKQMLKSNRALKRCEVFGEFLSAVAILAITEAQCDEAVEGRSRAMNALGIALLEFQEFANLYEKQHSEFGRDPRLLIDLGVTGLPKAKAISRRLVADGQQLEAAAGRLAVEEAVGGTQDEWRDFTAPEGSGLVSYIGIADGFDGDLIAAARASSGSKSQTI